jgi:hypothetical protein
MYIVLMGMIYTQHGNDHSEEHVLEAARKKLRALPPLPPEKREQVSQKEAISLLKPDIDGMREKGYTLEQIVKQLNDAGLVISLATLKDYLKPRKGGNKVPTGGRTEGVQPPATFAATAAKAVTPAS